MCIETHSSIFVYVICNTYMYSKESYVNLKTNFEYPLAEVDFSYFYLC